MFHLLAFVFSYLLLLRNVFHKKDSCKQGGDNDMDRTYVKTSILESFSIAVN